MQLKIDHLPEQYEIIYDTIADQLTDKGWCVLNDYFDTVLVDQLNSDILHYQTANQLSHAGIGRGTDFKIDLTVRSDKTQWLSRTTEAQCRFLDSMEAMRVALNRRLFLGLFEYESHFALYEKGSFYRKHKDSFEGNANRILSTVTYLNKNWQTKNGGQLIIYNSDTDTEREIIRVQPHAGTFVIFMSEDVVHEVSITQHPRTSIAGWFRCNNSIAGNIDPVL